MFASEWECIYTRKSLIDQCRRRTSLNNETSVTVQQVIQCAQCGSIKWRRILFVFFFACNRRTISGFIYSNELNWINTGNFIVYFWGEKRFFCEPYFSASICADCCVKCKTTTYIPLCLRCVCVPLCELDNARHHRTHRRDHTQCITFEFCQFSESLCTVAIQMR